MSAILVTGATGTLGRPTVQRLKDAGHDVRSLSRKSGPGIVTGDLLTGEGIDEALAGIDTVLHLATGGGGKKDVVAARILLDAAARARISHLVFISIVGVDRIPFPYYRGKLEVEKLTAASGVPFTILRATQFHDLIAGVFTAQRFLPVIFTPDFLVQPIAASEVAVRLTELAGSDPAGRVADIGGPEQRNGRSLARAWAQANGSRRPAVPLRLPGKAFASFAAGDAVVPGPGYGRVTFEDQLSAGSTTTTQGANS
jgi:uncharacterized protein YbjT (DUF2867 family)